MPPTLVGHGQNQYGASAPYGCCFLLSFNILAANSKTTKRLGMLLTYWRNISAISAKSYLHIPTIFMLRRRRNTDVRWFKFVVIRFELALCVGKFMSIVSHICKYKQRFIYIDGNWFMTWDCACKFLILLCW